MAPQPEVFCEEPWTGLFSVNADGSVTFCPCYAKVRIGNLKDSTIQELWNASELVEIRRSFVPGVIPPQCEGQLCPVVVNAHSPTVDDSEA